MKRVIISILILPLIACLYFGCEKPRPVEEFDLSPYATDFIITPATFTPGVNDIYSTLYPMIGPIWDAHKLNSNIVGDVYLTAFNFKISSPVGQNLNFCKCYDFYMQAGNQKEVRIGTIDPWISPTPTQTIISSSIVTTTAAPVRIKINGDCVPDQISCTSYKSVNLKNYFIENSIRVRMRATWSTSIATNVTITATYSVHVKGIQ